MTAQVPVRVDGVQHEEVEGDVLLFDGETLHRLTGTGAAAWRLVDDTATVDQIARALADEYATPVDIVVADVQALCEDLARQGLLLLTTPPAGVRHVRPAHVGYVRDGDHLLIADLRTGVRQALSPTGAQVWELACDGASTDDVLAALELDHPDLQPAQVLTLLDDLATAGLLQRRGSAEA